MVNNPLDYANRIILLISLYSIYKGKYNKIWNTALNSNRSFTSVTISRAWLFDSRPINFIQD